MSERLLYEIADDIRKAYGAGDDLTLLHWCNDNAAEATHFVSEWLSTYGGTFGYVVNAWLEMKSDPENWTPGAKRLKGLLKCYLSDARKGNVPDTFIDPGNRGATHVQRTPGYIDPTLDVRRVPACIVDIDGDVIALRKPVAKGNRTTKWDGWVFVTHGGREFGRPRILSCNPQGEITNGAVATKELLAKVRALVADPMAVIAASGHKTGVCAVCGRNLDDPQSVAQGIGPVCIKNIQAAAIAANLPPSSAIRGGALTQTQPLPPAKPKQVHVTPRTPTPSVAQETPEPEPEAVPAEGGRWVGRKGIDPRGRYATRKEAGQRAGRSSDKGR